MSLFSLQESFLRIILTIILSFSLTHTFLVSLSLSHSHSRSLYRTLTLALFIYLFLSFCFCLLHSFSNIKMMFEKVWSLPNTNNFQVIRGHLITWVFRARQTLCGQLSALNLCKKTSHLGILWNSFLLRVERKKTFLRDWRFWYDNYC